jgi:hypothetical protein
MEKIKVGLYLERAVHKRLKGLAERDHRSISGEVAWLVEHEWQPYVARLHALRSPGRGHAAGDEKTTPIGHARTKGTT